MLDDPTTQLFPPTLTSLAQQFANCGLAAGQTVLVHSSLSKVGWVVGGAEAVIRALLEVLTPSGTLMMPTHTTENTEPANWKNPPIPKGWWQTVRDHMPPFNPATTPTRQMGVIPELFRTFPGVVRSDHPIGSFAALGANAAYLTADHRLEDMFGATSPLGKLYELDGCLLLVGVTHTNNTSLHLAENRANFPGKRSLREGTAMLVNGVRQWVEFDMLDLETDDFDSIGTSYETTHGIFHHHIGNAEVRLMRQRPLVDYAVQYMERNRGLSNEG